MTMLDREQIGARLRIERRRKKESQNTTAKAIGITSAAYAMYETGARTPRDDVKMRIAEHFGTTVESLFFANHAQLK